MSGSKTQQNHTFGRYVVKTYYGEPVRAFVPTPLPPDPPVRLDGLQKLLEITNQAIGRLDGLTSFLPDPSLYIYANIRKEAVLSLQIEGTQSSLSDLLLYENDEAPGVPVQDVREVSNYVAAMNHGLARMHEGFPLSLRLICEIHDSAREGARGGEATGRIRAQPELDWRQPSGGTLLMCRLHRNWCRKVWAVWRCFCMKSNRVCRCW